VCTLNGLGLAPSEDRKVRRGYILKTAAKTNRTKPVTCPATKAETAEQPPKDANRAKNVAQTSEQWLKANPPPPPKTEAEKRAEWNAAHPDRPLPLPNQPPVTESEKVKRAVFQALGHDIDGKCPIGLDRHNNLLSMMRDGVPEELQFATLAAQTRVQCFAPLVHVRWNSERTNEELLNLKTFTACGWKWCKDKDKLTRERWSDLLSAAKDLRAHGLDPTGYAVAYYAAEYANLCRQEAVAPAYKTLQSEIENTPGAQHHFSPELLQAAEATRWVAAARKLGSNSTACSMQLFLNRVYVDIYMADALVAAAILFLFGFGDDNKDYAHLKESVRMAWTRTNEMSIRDDVTKAAPMMGMQEKDNVMAREALASLRAMTTNLFDRMASSLDLKNARPK